MESTKGTVTCFLSLQRILCGANASLGGHNRKIEGIIFREKYKQGIKTLINNPGQVLRLNVYIYKIAMKAHTTNTVVIKETHI